MCLGAVIQTGAIDRREDGAFPTAISHQTPDQICSFVNELSRGGVDLSTGVPAAPLFRSWILFIVVK
jgi:hypothetical protein